MNAAPFLSENAGRSYPFVEEAGLEAYLPEGLVLDAGFVLGHGTGFVAGTHSIWLQSIASESGVRYLTFASDAPGLEASPLAVAVPETAAEYDVVDSEREWASSSEPGDCQEAPLWEAWLVVGSMTGVSDLSVPARLATIEPARIQSLGDASIRSLGLANGDRVRAESPDGCPTPSTETPGDPPFIAATCLGPDPRFREGYNSAITLSQADNSITIGAAVGSGAGEPCEEVLVFDGEEPPAGSLLLSGGPSCSELIRSINGVSRARMRIRAGTGVKVTPGDSASELKVTVDLSGLSKCGGPAASSSSQG